MRPDARAQSAINILDQWFEGREGLDRILTAWGRANRYAGSKDRAAIADLVYDAVRRLRSASWVAGQDVPTSGRSVLLGSLLLDGADPDLTFSGTQYAPEALSDAERAGIRDLDPAPRAVRLDFPDALDADLTSVPDADLDALRQRAPLDLRVNTIKSDPASAIAALEEDDISVGAVEGAPLALRVVSGARKVARSRAYLEGLVEIQDAGSQLLAALAEPAPGAAVMDLCAGGGGKALALAAAARGTARIVAHDIAADRMQEIPGRAERAGVEIECMSSGHLAEFKGTFDLVFIDAPCSGSGAWRRNPDAKWRLQPTRLAELNDIQSGLLEQGAELCKPGGRIVYGTCSLFTCENEDIVEAFLKARPGWHTERLHRSAPSQGMDGFFGVVLSQGKDSRPN